MGQEKRNRAKTQKRRNLEMKPLAKKGNCTNCRHAEATHSNECRPCHCVTIVMVGEIQGAWGIKGYEELADSLERVTLAEYQSEARSRGATLCLRMAIMMDRLAKGANIHPEEMKRLVIRRLRENLAEWKGIADIPAYNRMVGDLFAHLKSRVIDAVRITAVAKEAEDEF